MKMLTRSSNELGYQIDHVFTCKSGYPRDGVYTVKCEPLMAFF
jgi:hypothetical protein